MLLNSFAKFDLTFFKVQPSAIPKTWQTHAIGKCIWVRSAWVGLRRQAAGRSGQFFARWAGCVRQGKGPDR